MGDFMANKNDLKTKINQKLKSGKLSISKSSLAENSLFFILKFLDL